MWLCGPLLFLNHPKTSCNYNCNSAHNFLMKCIPLDVMFCRIRKYPSLEFTLMCLLCYFPYVLADVLGLSGIMAILFAGMHPVPRGSGQTSGQNH